MNRDRSLLLKRASLFKIVAELILDDPEPSFHTKQLVNIAIVMKLQEMFPENEVLDMLENKRDLHAGIKNIAIDAEKLHIKSLRDLLLSENEAIDSLISTVINVD